MLLLEYIVINAYMFREIDVVHCCGIQINGMETLRRPIDYLKSWLILNGKVYQ